MAARRPDGGKRATPAAGRQHPGAAIHRPRAGRAGGRLTAFARARDTRGPHHPQPGVGTGAGDRGALCLPNDDRGRAVRRDPSAPAARIDRRAAGPDHAARGPAGSGLRPPAGAADSPRRFQGRDRRCGRAPAGGVRAVPGPACRDPQRCGAAPGPPDPVETRVTELLAPARPVRVRVDADGVPTHLESAAGWQPVTRILNRWRIECDWWRSPVSREYWRLLIDDDLALECYCNRASAGWFVGRVYHYGLPRAALH